MIKLVIGIFYESKDRASNILVKVSTQKEI